MKIIAPLPVHHSAVVQSSSTRGLALNHHLALLQLDCSALLPHDHHHAARTAFQIFYDFPEVVFDQIVEVLTVFCLSFELIVQQTDFLINASIFLCKGCYFVV